MEKVTDTWDITTIINNKTEPKQKTELKKKSFREPYEKVN